MNINVHCDLLIIFLSACVLACLNWSSFMGARLMTDQQLEEYVSARREKTSGLHLYQDLETFSLHLPKKFDAKKLHKMQMFEFHKKYGKYCRTRNGETVEDCQNYPKLSISEDTENMERLRQTEFHLLYERICVDPNWTLGISDQCEDFTTDDEYDEWMKNHPDENGRNGFYTMLNNYRRHRFYDYYRTTCIFEQCLNNECTKRDICLEEKKFPVNDRYLYYPQLKPKNE